MYNLFFITHNYSGAKTYANELLSDLAEREEIIIHVVYWESEAYEEYTLFDNANILNIHIPRQRGKEFSLEKYSRRCMDLLDPLLQGKKNLIFHLNYSTHVKIGIEARKRYKAKLIYTYHFLPDYFSLFAKQELPKEEVMMSIDVLEKEVINYADFVICVTQFAREVVIGYFDKNPKKVYAIHNGLGTDSGDMLPNIPKEKLKVSLGFNSKDKIFLFVGKLEVRKGLKPLIEAFKILVEKHYNVSLVIAGNGDFKEYFSICKGVRGKVIFTGKIDKEELTQFYQIADVGVIPSLFEQCSYVALEMMQQGLPIIVTEAPGLSELFINNENALIIPLLVNNNTFDLEPYKKVLVEAMSRLLTEKTLGNKLRYNIMEQWNKKHKAKNMGNATFEVYKQLFFQSEQDEVKINRMYKTNNKQ